MTNNSRTPDPYSDVVDLLAAVIVGIRQARDATTPETRTALLTDATGRACQAAVLLRVLRVGAHAQASPFGPVRAGLVQVASTADLDWRDRNPR